MRKDSTEQNIPMMTQEEFRTMITEIMQGIFQEFREPVSQEPKEFLNAKEAARHLNMALPTLYEKTSNKILPHYKYGNKIVFKRDELTEWMLTGKVETMSDLQLQASNAARKGKEARASRDRNALPRDRD